MDVSKEMKIKIIAYMIISSISFSYMVTPEKAGISITVFSIIQLVCLWLISPDKKRLLFFIPILILSLNSFLSACTIWKVPNFIICVVLMSCMFFNFDLKKDSLRQFSQIFAQVGVPLKNFRQPFMWIAQASGDKMAVVRRIAIALLITVPCVIGLVLVLSSADMVFSLKTESLIEDIFDLISFNAAFKLIAGIVAGIYLTGALCSAWIPQSETEEKTVLRKGDLIIINIILFCVLLVYTLFVVVQFKYLFAGATLPEELTYTEYARKGFFELLALTGINIAAIYAVVNFTKLHHGKWALVSKVLCIYLCVVTVVLLASSFYRMLLYTNDDGLTRLRFFVMGFLWFELFGLLITFVYIIKPLFNLPLVYVIIALTYYLVLNIIPYDYFIAKDQISRYMAGKRQDIEYVFTLSADAAPALQPILESTSDENMKMMVNDFFESKTGSDIPDRWQRYNFSIEKAKKIVK